MLYPPVIRELEFVGIDTVDENRILTNFTPFIRQLHHFLNQLSCLKDLQQIRRKWKPRARGNEAFGTIATEPRHWYTFNHGGRNEAQFNVGLYTTHFRIGIGFEFSKKKGGDPEIVNLVYSCFTNIIQQDIVSFDQFVHDSGLEIEWCPKDVNELRFISTEEVTQWLLQPPRDPIWIFIGRLLKRKVDTKILENLSELKNVFENIFGGFKPIWEKTQIMSKQLENA